MYDKEHNRVIEETTREKKTSRWRIIFTPDQFYNFTILIFIAITDSGCDTRYQELEDI